VFCAALLNAFCVSDEGIPNRSYPNCSSGCAMREAYMDSIDDGFCAVFTGVA